MPVRFYEFEDFRVDVIERRLWQNGIPVVLTPKAFDMLVVLVENRGKTVEKEPLIQAVWAGTHVEEGSLNRCISTLRKVLGDDSSEQRLIKTLPKLGYRFTDRVIEVVADESAGVKDRLDVPVSVTPSIPAASPFSKRRQLVLTLSVVAGFVLFLAWTISSKQESTQSIEGLTKHELQQLESRSTPNTEALEDYVKGRALWHNRSAEGLYQSIVLLERAVRTDPNFALAHAALADAYAFDVHKRNVAKEHATTAINLDPTFGQPHATIGFVQMFWDWDVAGAGESFKRAVELSPEYATAHQWYAINLVISRHGTAALAEMKRAVELEPDALAISADLCQMYYFLQKYDDAITQCRQVLEKDPSFLNAHAYLYDVYMAKEMYDEAFDEFFTIQRLKSDFVLPTTEIDRLQQAYARGGITEFWRARLVWLERNADSYGAARYYARLGDKNKAIEWLQRSRTARNFEFVFVFTDPVFKILDEEPEFRELADSFYGSQKR
jgi:DNA-binding winged helix-turn-helix (wHTH) protein/tetratricopeptide (TPR) repeat protein